MEKGSERKPILFEDENGNSIVFENGDYRISVDRPNNARKAILWHKEEVSGKIYWAKRGVLNTSLSELRYQEEGDTDFVDYLKISEVEIEKEHRGKGYGNQLYKAIIDYKGDNIVGLLSYTPNRVNKSQVPSIWKKFGGRTLKGNEDYQIIRFGKPKQYTPKKSDLATGWERKGPIINGGMKVPDGELKLQKVEHVRHSEYKATLSDIYDG